MGTKNDPAPEADEAKPVKFVASADFTVWYETALLSFKKGAEVDAHVGQYLANTGGPVDVVEVAEG